MVLWITAGLTVFVGLLDVGWVSSWVRIAVLPAALFYQYPFDPRDYLRKPRSLWRVSRG